MPTDSQEIRRLIQESLGLPPVRQPQPTVPVEGHVCDFPLWSFSNKRSSQTRLHIDYDDSSFLTIEAPKGMPSPMFPGYLDVILFYGQRDLFLTDQTQISVYSILKQLGLDPTNGMNYHQFRQDMNRIFSLALITDRFRDPATGQRSHVDYFRVMRRMKLAKTRQEVSTFFFDDLFLQSLRSGYLKRLDFEFALHLDREGEPLARFLYGHLVKRLGEKSIYQREVTGFLRDIGLGHVAEMAPYRRNERLKRVVYPALDLLKGEVLRHYELNGKGVLLFIPKD